jgi:RND family efflux transporter MFP subunit
MNHSLHPLIRWAIFCGAPFSLAGCSPPGQDMAAPTPSVTVSFPLEKEVTDYSIFTGRTAAMDSVQVRARIWGYIQKINFKEGDEVIKDQVLFQIDPDVYQTAVEQAKARVAVAEAQQNLSETLAHRNAVLRLKQAVSEEDYEKSEADRAAAAATANSARADLKRAQLDLDYTQVRAPVAGRVGRAMATVGNLIQSGEMGGTVLTTVVSVDPVWAYFDVDDLAFLRLGRPASPEALPPLQLGLADEDGYPHEGKIDFVDNQVDPGTGTMRMRGVFPNADRRLTPGLFARVRVPLSGAHKAVLVADRAVDTDQGQKVVYVVGPDDIAEQRLVRLGGLHDGLREIESGVRPGERVVVDGLQRVRAGAPVAPTLVEMPVQTGDKPAS